MATQQPTPPVRKTVELPLPEGYTWGEYSTAQFLQVAALAAALMAGGIPYEELLCRLHGYRPEVK